MGGLMLLLGAMLGLVFNFMSSAKYATEVLGVSQFDPAFAPWVGGAIGGLLVVIEFLVLYMQKNQKIRSALLGEEEAADTLRALIAPWAVQLILFAAVFVDIYTTTAALSGWDARLSPDENLKNMLPKSLFDIRVFIIKVFGGIFVSVAPESAIVSLLDRGVGRTMLANVASAVQLFVGIARGMLRIPEEARLVAFGRKSFSVPEPGPTVVFVFAVGVIITTMMQAVNLYTTIAAARDVLKPYAGWIGFLGLALLISGFQSMFWGPDRGKVSAFWMTVSLIVDYATAWWFFARRWPADISADIIAAAIALFVVIPELVLNGILRAVRLWSVEEIEAATASLGAYIGVIIKELHNIEGKKGLSTSGYRPEGSTTRATRLGGPSQGVFIQEDH